MADMKRMEIRQANLKLLVAEAGGQASLARAAGTNPSYISQILSGNIKRNLGNELATKLERAMAKPEGWMDRDHTLELPATFIALAVRIATKLTLHDAELLIDALDLGKLIIAPNWMGFDRRKRNKRPTKRFVERRKAIPA